MGIRILLQKTVADIAVRYLLDETTGMVELGLFPAGTAELPTPSGAERELVPLAWVKFARDGAASGFGAGRTMRYSETMQKFRFESQNESGEVIRTVLRHESGCRLVHRLSRQGDFPVFFCDVSLENASNEALEVELLESFTFGGILAGESNETLSRLKLHRFRSRWCSEAYHECIEAPFLQLERDPGGVVHSERYGQVGTLPVRGFHPFGALEDPVNGIVWGAQLGWTGSWQMEFSLCGSSGPAFGGGLADYEFGHWRKTLLPGEILAGSRAFLACVQGTFDDFCARLVRGIGNTLHFPATEEELPVIFNEWCTSWGEPTEEKLTAIADRLRELPVRYLVIDAGWYKEETGAEWSSGQGDWVVNRRLFPNGIAAAAEKIRERGLIPGIWFEAEVAGKSSRAFYEDEAHMLHSRGRVITAGPRRFWNLNDPEAEAILGERVVSFLHRNGFGYIKIDYNETVGIGCDDPDSPGEGLRKQVLGTHRFFRRLAEENPGLVIENCASGGHRLEPAMYALSSMSSFSDAHERDTISVIAASLHRLMPPRQSQIWAVMRREADETHIAYLLSSAMLGRICLSGDILDLSPEQWALVKRALAFYRKLVPLLKDGDSVYLPSLGPSRTVLRGGQVLARTGRDGRELALYFHAFGEPPEVMRYLLPQGEWEFDSEFAAPGTGEIELAGSSVTLRHPAAFSGRVLLFKR